MIINVASAFNRLLYFFSFLHFLFDKRYSNIHPFYFHLYLYESTYINGIARSNQQTELDFRVYKLSSFIFQHPYFHPQSLQNDVALIRVSSPIAYNTYVQPIQMDYDPNQFQPGYDCVITGWGYIIVNNGKCGKSS